MSDEDKRALARALTSLGEFKLSRGDAAGAEAAFEKARALLTEDWSHASDVDKTFVNVQGQSDMTPAQVAKRARRIAEGHAGDDPRLLALSKSKWGSAAKYARQRLGIAPSTFSNYMAGKVAPPDTVMMRVAKDFPGLALDFWTPPDKA